MDDTLKLIEKIPLKIAKAVSATGKINIIIGNGSVTDFHQLAHLKNIRPRGWPAGRTWTDVAGADGPPQVVLGTHGMAYSNVVLHEIGHAVDHTYVSSEFPQLSSHPEFKKLYAELDSQKMNPYFYQGGSDAGPEELFASLFAHSLNPLNSRISDLNDSMYESILDFVGSLISKLS